MRQNLKINIEPGELKIHSLSLGVGVQSSTIYLMAQTGYIAPFDVAVFVDVGYERDATYRYLRYLQTFQNKFRIDIIRPKEKLAEAATRIRVSDEGNFYMKKLLPLFTHNLTTSRVGKIPTRGCTSEFKVEVLQSHLRALAGVRYGQNWPSVVNYLGISTDEAQRMKDSRVPWAINKYPLIELGLSRRDCMDWLDANDFLIPHRSSCYFCPFQSAASWRDLMTDEPHKFEAACEFEDELNKTAKATGLRSRLSLTKRHRYLGQANFFKDMPDGFGNECEGLCGV